MDVDVSRCDAMIADLKHFKYRIAEACEMMRRSAEECIENAGFDREAGDAADRLFRCIDMYRMTLERVDAEIYRLEIVRTYDAVPPPIYGDFDEEDGKND